MALGMGAGNAAAFKLVPHFVPEAVGGASGWVGGLGALGGFVLPNLLTLLGAAGGRLSGGFIVFALLGASCLAMAVLLARREKKI
jgi:NNP family nitrate/nitrite transporter-like MFS transporter